MPKQKPSVLNDYQKRKQAFALRLLFWLLPWPLSRHLPRSLQIIYYGPSASPPGFPPTPPMPPYIPPGQPPPIKPPTPPPGWTPPPWFMPYPSPPPYWDDSMLPDPVPPPTPPPGGPLQPPLPGSPGTPTVPPDGPPSPNPPYPGTPPPPTVPPQPLPPGQIISGIGFLPSSWYGYPIFSGPSPIASPISFFDPGYSPSPHINYITFPDPGAIQNDYFTAPLQSFWTQQFTTGGSHFLTEDLLVLIPGDGEPPPFSWIYQQQLEYDTDVELIIWDIIFYDDTSLWAGLALYVDSQNYALLGAHNLDADEAYTHIKIDGVLHTATGLPTLFPTHVRIKRYNNRIYLLIADDSGIWYDFTPSGGPYFLPGSFFIGIFANKVANPSAECGFDWIKNM